MKGAENVQVTQAICTISHPMSQAAQTIQEVAQRKQDEVLSMLLFDKSYIEEAKRMFLRWRALVTRYYILTN